MSNLLPRFSATASTPRATPTQPAHHLDPFGNLATQDLSTLIETATQALRVRGYISPFPFHPYSHPNPPIHAYSPIVHLPHQPQPINIPPHPPGPPPSRPPQQNSVQPPERPNVVPPPPQGAMTPQSTEQQQQVALIPSQPRVPDMYDNAKIEQIICSGLKPLTMGVLTT
jgi:hypothetical protein